MRWFSKEADNTYLILGGITLGVLIVVGLFTLHAMSPAETMLSPEIIMAIVGIPAVMFSYAMGKRQGESNGNGNKTKDKEETK